MITPAAVGCKRLLGGLHEMKQQAHLRIDQVAAIGCQPMSGFAGEVCLAEPVARAIHGMSSLADQIQDLIGIVSDGDPQVVSYPSRQGDYLVWCRLTRSLESEEHAVDPLETRVGQSDRSLVLSSGDGGVNFSEHAVESFRVS